MSESSVDQQDLFSTSGFPRYLEWYRCYMEPSTRRPVDGLEYRRHEHDWDDWAKAKWRFFYRPVKALVGRPQKREIEKARAAIEGWRRRVDHAKVAMIRDGILALLVAWLFYSLQEALAVLPVIVGGIRLLVLSQERGKGRKAIEGWEGRIAGLKGEIRELLTQIKSYPETEEIEERYGEEVCLMERTNLAEVVNKRSADETLFDEVAHVPLQRDNPYGLHTLLVEGWGALQPASNPGPLGEESSGLQWVLEDVGRGLTTWRRGTRGQPLYRVVYLQYVFLLDKSITVCAYFYDFVSGNRYGRRSETFQYEHVSNYALREVGLEEEEWVEKVNVPRALRQQLFGQEINAFVLAVSSGAHLRCVLADGTVVRGINEWMSQDEIRRNLEAKLGQDQQNESSRTEGDVEEDDFWADLDPEERQEVYREVFENQRALEDQGIHLARRVLQQIRDAVDQHVLKVEPVRRYERVAM